MGGVYLCLMIFILVQLSIANDDATSEGLIKQSTQEVTVPRNSRATRIAVFQLCGGISESHSPRLIVYQDGNRRPRPVFPSNNGVPAQSRTVQGVAAALWDTDRNECKYLAARLWPSYFSNEVENVSVVLKLPSSTHGVHNLSNKHRIDFLFIDGDPSTDLVETSTNLVALKANDTVPQIVTIFVDGTLGITSYIVRTSLGNIHPDSGSLQYTNAQEFGLTAVVWNTTNPGDEEVVVGVWPNLLQEEQNLPVELWVGHGVQRKESIQLYFQPDPVTTEPVTTIGTTAPEPETSTTIVSELETSTATDDPTQSADSTTFKTIPSVGSPLEGQLTVGIPVAVGAIIIILVVIVPVAVIVTVTRRSRKQEEPSAV